MPKIDEFIKNNPVAKSQQQEKKESNIVTSIGAKELCMTNVVSDETLKRVQQETLRKLKDFLAKTYGPMGSYTKIISGSGKDTIAADYSKDGLKVLKNILFDQPIELALQSELREVCNYVDHEVGDGTTSAVVLSSLIYDKLLSIMEETHTLPRLISRAFDNVLTDIKAVIESKANTVTADDIYDICMVSTNGNEKVSKEISDLYKEYGIDLDIEVDISNDSNTKVTEYNGLVINEGYSSPAAINNADKNTIEVHNPAVYYFKDPIDTPEMLSYFARIIEDNILIPEEEGEEEDFKPTVIITPKIGRDGSGILTKLDRLLYSYNARKDFVHKPQILICTNLAGTDEIIAEDIQQICKCKAIGKFISFEEQDTAKERGEAVFIDKETNETNIHEFAGHAELVSADPEKTIFVNPVGMMNGENINEQIISYLEAEIKKLEAINEDKVKIKMKKNELRALKGNMITYYVGGISVADRNALKDLVEDAVKNCKSASINGWGRAANFEGLEASVEIIASEKYKNDSLEYKVLNGILQSYTEAATTLYSTVLPHEDALQAVLDSLNKTHAPYNVASLYNGSYSTEPRVITSICTDIEILNAISKIVTPMVTSNQCLLQTTTLNKY